MQWIKRNNSSRVGSMSFLCSWPNYTIYTWQFIVKLKTTTGAMVITFSVTLMGTGPSVSLPVSRPAISAMIANLSSNGRSSGAVCISEDGATDIMPVVCVRHCPIIVSMNAVSLGHLVCHSNQRSGLFALLNWFFCRPFSFNIIRYGASRTCRRYFLTRFAQRLRGVCKSPRGLLFCFRV